MALTPSQGSPPRMRGKVTVEAKGEKPTGITPAYAGKRPLRPPPCRIYRDHPRVCGEKPYNQRHSIPFSGSPPRMRGKEGLNAPDLEKPGITPAYAGKSDNLAAYDGTDRDHPRVCGEKSSVSFLIRHIGGSPPRMRGKGDSALGK